MQLLVKEVCTSILNLKHHLQNPVAACSIWIIKLQSFPQTETHKFKIIKSNLQNIKLWSYCTFSISFLPHGGEKHRPLKKRY